MKVEEDPWVPQVGVRGSVVLSGDRLTVKVFCPGERGLDGLSRSIWGARRWLLQIHPGDRRPPSAPPPACSRSPLKMAQWWKWSTSAGFVP